MVQNYYEDELPVTDVLWPVSVRLIICMKTDKWGLVF